MHKNQKSKRVWPLSRRRRPRRPRLKKGPDPSYVFFLSFCVNLLYVSQFSAISNRSDDGRSPCPCLPGLNCYYYNDKCLPVSTKTGESSQNTRIRKKRLKNITARTAGKQGRKSVSSSLVSRFSPLFTHRMDIRCFLPGHRLGKKIPAVPAIT